MAVPGMANNGSIIAGVGKFYIAALGVAWPAITGDSLTWTGWTEMSTATDGGWDVSYKETNTDHRIDQEANPVMITPDTAEGTVTLHLAAMDHAKLVFTISNATVTVVPAGSGTVGYSKMGIGGSAVKVFQIGIEGLSPANPSGGTWWELTKIWKAIPNSEIKKTFQKGQKQMVECQWRVLADQTQAASETFCATLYKNAVAA